jgi:hypothetical protein
VLQKKEFSYKNVKFHAGLPKIQCNETIPQTDSVITIHHCTVLKIYLQVNLSFSSLTIGIAAAVAIVEANDMDRITVGH